MLIVITKDGCHKMGENNPPSPSTIFLETSREVALEALLCRVGRQKRPSTGSLWKHFCVGTRKHTFREVALEALLCRDEEANIFLETIILWKH